MPNLELLHPDLKAKIDKILAAMAALGFPMRIVQGVRTTEEQQRLYAQGRTTPGKVVTECDGIKKRSNHQIQADGFGHAVDCAFIDNPDTPIDETWSDKSPWTVYGCMVQSLGLKWGGNWNGPLDRPHAELPLSA